MRGVVVSLIAWILCSSTGCESQSVRTSPGREVRAWSVPAWSEPVEGVQCRLRVDRTRWLSNETPVLRVDVRNTGARIFPFLPEHQQQLCLIEYDGIWRQWPSPIRIDSPIWPFGPGVQLNNIGIQLHSRFGIKIQPGKHTIRVTFNFENVHIVSWPIVIEVARAR
mgnify:CR=1 FL=1